MLNGQYFYNQTLKKAVAVFGTVFNNIKTLKPGGDKTYNRVPLAYGPRKKFIARIQTDLIGPDKETIAIKLPRMSFEITNIEADTNTKLNKFNKRILSYDNVYSNATTIGQSTPYNIGIELNIYALNQDDALQIFEQILPHFSPEYTISVKDIEGPGIVTDVPIILNSVSISDDYEGDFQTRRALVYTLGFSMKIKFSKGVSNNSNIIRYIDANLYDNINDTVIDEQIRVAVSNDSNPPLDSSDTISVAYDFLSSVEIEDYATQNIQLLIKGKDPSDDSRYIITQDTYNSSLEFERNPNFFGKDLVGITSISPWNSYANNYRAGVAITPRHVLFVDHSSFWVPAGQTIYFVTRNNEVIARTIQAHKTFDGYDTFSGDFSIGLLNEDLPSSVEYTKVLPRNFYKYINAERYISDSNLLFNYTSTKDFLILNTDQETGDKVSIRSIDKITKGTFEDHENLFTSDDYAGVTFKSPIDSFAAQWFELGADGDSGSPLFMVLDNEIVLLSLFTSMGSGGFIGTKRNIDYINAMITEVDNDNSVTSGYQLTEYDMSVLSINNVYNIGSKYD